ncbi:UNVERIFIED_CONTAM: hypothetical protein HDU68_010431 [Siphonaria sp. JEL0065]|nr:hypothetical protein HDU68_010431 [Siphonaria sp. JEL0065]
MSKAFFLTVAGLVALSIALPSRQQQILSPEQPSRTIFGPNGDAGWGEASSWRSVTDRVRGGISTASLNISDIEKAVFSGILDTSTLGGAGFASVRANLSTTDFSNFEGIQITSLKGDGFTYALNLYNELGGWRPDGRRESSVEFKYSFKPTTSANNELQIFEAPFEDFVPYYRGRPVEGVSKKLNASNIVAVSVMVQSYFDEQKGPYHIELKSIECY